MRKFLALLLMLSLCLLMLPSPGHCEATHLNRWGGVDRKILLGREMPYDLVYRGAGRDGVSTIVTQVSTLNSTHLAFGILLLDGCAKTFTMDAGEVGKEITLIKNGQDDRALVLSFDIRSSTDETAHTGFTSVQWDTAGGGFVTLTWLDSTRGWFITGAHGVAITR